MAGFAPEDRLSDLRYLFAIAPLSRQVFDWGYRTFATNRYRISSACHLKPERTVGARAEATLRAADAPETKSASGGDR